jgi:hypothetical protein
MPGFSQPLGHGTKQPCEGMRDSKYWAAGGEASGPSDMVLRQWVQHEWALGDQILKDQAEGRGSRGKLQWPGWESAWKKFS